MRVIAILGLLTTLLISACGPVNEAERSDVISRTLTVRDIDREARSFDVTGDGQRFTLRVSEAVRNFDEIEVGDKLDVSYIETVAVSMADPADPGDTIILDGAAVAEEGEKPGIAGAEVISTVVEFISYDTTTKTAVVRTGEGNILATKVSPELRGFARSRERGDRIELDIVTAVAVGISPSSS